MRLLVMSVLDAKVGAFMPPFYGRSKGEGIRAFSDLVNRSGHDFHNHPEDFTLCLLGFFEDKDGILTSCSMEKLVTGLDCRADAPAD